MCRRVFLVRAFAPDEFDRVERDLQTRAARTIIPDVQVKASMTRNFQPRVYLLTRMLMDLGDEPGASQ